MKPKNVFIKSTYMYFLVHVITITAVSIKKNRKNETNKESDSSNQPGLPLERSGGNGYSVLNIFHKVTSAIKYRLYDRSLYQNLLTLIQECWSYLTKCNRGPVFLDKVYI